MSEELKKGETIIYKDKKAKIEVRLENNTVWLTQAEIAVLFGTKIARAAWRQNAWLL